MNAGDGFCIDCGQGLMFPGSRGPKAMRCPKHRKAHTNELTKARVRKLRQNRKRPDKSFIVHIKKFAGKHRGETWCGVTQSTEEVGRALLSNGETIYRYCKTCKAAFKKAHGVELNG